MKKILILLFAFIAFNSQAQNPLVGKPSLKLVFDVAQTKKWDFTVDTNNMLEINGTGGTPSIRFTDFSGTGNRILAVDADGDLIRTTVDPALTGLPAGSNTQIQYNNAGAFGGDTGFTTNGAGSVNISGDLDVDQININGGTYTGTNSILFTPGGGGNMRLTTGTFYVNAPEDLTDGSRVGSSIIATIDADQGQAALRRGFSNGYTSTGYGLDGLADGGMTDPALSIWGRIEAADDTGADPIIIVNAAQDAGGVIATRPLLTLSNGYTSTDKVFQFDANKTFNLYKTTNQIVTGTGSNLTTLNFPASSGAVTVTMPNVTTTIPDFVAPTAFTPVLSDAISGGNTATGTFTAYYTKKGKEVTVWLDLVNISTSGMTGANTLFIQDLPFAGNSAGLRLSNGVVSTSGNVNFTNYLTAGFSALSSTSCVVYDNRDSSTRTMLTVADVPTGTGDLFITMTYFID